MKFVKHFSAITRLLLYSIRIKYIVYYIYVFQLYIYLPYFFTKLLVNSVKQIQIITKTTPTCRIHTQPLVVTHSVKLKVCTSQTQTLTSLRHWILCLRHLGYRMHLSSLKQKPFQLINVSERRNLSSR